MMVVNDNVDNNDNTKRLFCNKNDKILAQYYIFNIPFSFCCF